MKKLKKSPRQQLEKFSTIFMQLGLVLVLFVVFVSLEHETEQTATLEVVSKIEDPYVFTFDKPVIYVREAASKPKIEPQRQVITTIIAPVVVHNSEDDTLLVSVPVDDIPIETKVKIADDIVEEDIINLEDEPKGISFVSKIPVFKGCEGLSELEGRKCFDKKINKLVQRHFDAGLGNELGLKKGKNRIFTQFIIDKQGNIVDVKINAPHNALKKEVSRIIKKIPMFTPGENNGAPVKVRYTLPISFKVD